MDSSGGYIGGSHSVVSREGHVRARAKHRDKLIHAGQRICHNHISQRYIPGVPDKNAIGHITTGRRQVGHIRNFVNCQRRILRPDYCDCVVICDVVAFRIFTGRYGNINYLAGIRISLCHGIVLREKP